MEFISICKTTNIKSVNKESKANRKMDSNKVDHNIDEINNKSIQNLS